MKNPASVRGFSLRRDNVPQSLLQRAARYSKPNDVLLHLPQARLGERA